MRFPRHSLRSRSRHIFANARMRNFIVVLPKSRMFFVSALRRRIRRNRSRFKKRQSVEIMSQTIQKVGKHLVIALDSRRSISLVRVDAFAGCHPMATSINLYLATRTYARAFSVSLAFSQKYRRVGGRHLVRFYLLTYLPTYLVSTTTSIEPMRCGSTLCKTLPARCYQNTITSRRGCRYFCEPSDYISPSSSVSSPSGSYAYSLGLILYIYYTYLIFLLFFFCTYVLQIRVRRRCVCVCLLYTLVYMERVIESDLS